MLLECPACHAQFKVPDGAIPATGRTVRCSACKHQWHALPPIPQEPRNVAVDTDFLTELTKVTDAPEVPETPDVTTQAPQTVSEEDAKAMAAIEAALSNAAPKSPPKPAKPRFELPLRPFKVAVPALAACWLILAFYAYFPSWANAPIIGSIYRLMGVVPTDGVVLADIAMQPQKEGQRTRFLISGNIVNQEASVRVVPTVRVQMLDRQNDVVWEREYEVNKTLTPGEIYPFRITNAETSFGHNVAQLVVDVGHPLDMMFR
ncbi:MAG: zinc-ribbon domain-containing protein [Rickettsiales bacterium]